MVQERQHYINSTTGSVTQFIHEGFLRKKILCGWKKYWCVLRGCNLEIYRSNQLPDRKKPKRVVSIENFNADIRFIDQIEIINKKGRRKVFKFDPDQIGERVEWIRALQTVLIFDNVRPDIPLLYVFCI